MALLDVKRLLEAVLVKPLVIARIARIIGPWRNRPSRWCRDDSDAGTVVAATECSKATAGRDCSPGAALPGPAFIASIAYVTRKFRDEHPGRSLLRLPALWVILASNLMAMLVHRSPQNGIATRPDLAEHCRNAFPIRSS